MLLLVAIHFTLCMYGHNNTMKYLALSQMCSIFAPLVPMHAGLLQRSVQESTKEMASLLALKMHTFLQRGRGACTTS